MNTRILQTLALLACFFSTVLASPPTGPDNSVTIHLVDNSNSEYNVLIEQAVRILNEADVRLDDDTTRTLVAKRNSRILAEPTYISWEGVSDVPAIRVARSTTWPTVLCTGCATLDVVILDRDESMIEVLYVTNIDLVELRDHPDPTLSKLYLEFEDSSKGNKR